MEVSDLYAASVRNSALSEYYAQNARNWSAEQAQITRDFNANEAAKNRNWQAVMSNTAHQREVRDLVAAGLNPVLSAGGGNGATVGSGAAASASIPATTKADVDVSANHAAASMVGSLANAAATIQASANSAQALMYSADRSFAGSQLVAAATRYASDKNYAASTYGSDKGYDASKYKADMDFARDILGLIGDAAGAFFKFGKLGKGRPIGF